MRPAAMSAFALRAIARRGESGRSRGFSPGSSEFSPHLGRVSSTGFTVSVALFITLHVAYASALVGRRAVFGVYRTLNFNAHYAPKVQNFRGPNLRKIRSPNFPKM